jgi:hypothetical protein
MGWLGRLFGRRRERRVVQLEGDGDFECEVVGESHYQQALGQLVGGKTSEGHEFACLALLEREPANRHDGNAVTVSIGGYKVGYLSRPHAAVMATVFKKHRLDAAQADAVIVGGWSRGKGRAPEGHFGVRLDIPV